ncbi:MAG: alpha/beta hydrolase [Candidatus Puniceispirillaceae bacterium]
MKHNLHGETIHVATGGLDFDATKPVLVFIHGSGQSHLTWVQQTRYFAHRGFAVLAPDFPGHGLSDDMIRLSVGLEDIADIIADFENGFRAAARVAAKAAE